jgi:hypothetical protein
VRRAQEPPQQADKHRRTSAASASERWGVNQPPSRSLNQERRPRGERSSRAASLFLFRGHSNAENIQINIFLISFITITLDS